VRHHSDQKFKSVRKLAATLRAGDKFEKDGVLGDYLSFITNVTGRVDINSLQVCDVPPDNVLLLNTRGQILNTFMA
jgi:hypothetical protein